MELKCSEHKWDFLRAFRIPYWFGGKIGFSLSFCPKIVIFGDLSTFEASAAALVWLATTTSIFF